MRHGCPRPVRQHNSHSRLHKTLDLPIIKPTMARKRANTQNTGEKAETKWKRQHKNPHTKSGSFRPNLSEIGLTEMPPKKKAAKITEVETKPSDPRSHTRSNCKRVMDN